MTLPVQSAEDTQRYVGIAVITGVIVLVIFNLLETLLRPSWLKKITDAKRTYFYTCVISDIHAVIVSGLTIWTLLNCNDMYRDRIWGECDLASIACAITSGYMFGDMLITVIRWKLVGDVGFLIHHITSAVAFLYVIMNGSYRFFAMIRLLAELSTIFVNFRMMLYDLELQNSAAYFYNGLIMVFSFTIARIVPFPFYLYHLISVTGTDGYNQSGLGRYIVWGSLFSLDILNIIWYRKMLKGAVKVWKSHHSKNDIQTTDSRAKSGKQG